MAHLVLFNVACKSYNGVMKNQRFLLLSWLACGCFILGSVQANQLLIPANYSTIQAGIDAASAGDTVLVSPGNYYENLDFKGKAITVASAAERQVAVITAPKSIPVGWGVPLPESTAGCTTMM